MEKPQRGKNKKNNGSRTGISFINKIRRNVHALKLISNLMTIFYSLFDKSSNLFQSLNLNMK